MKPSKLAKTVVIIVIAVNVLIFIVKGLIGVQIGSLALLSDSIHTLSDSASSIAVYLGLKISEKPPDEEHPYGHGRADMITVLVVGLILILAAINFLSEGIQSLFVGTNGLSMPSIFYIIILATAIMKEVMAEVSYFVGNKAKSESLKADSWHHRGDAITTILVILAIYGSEMGLNFLDPLAGIIISFILVYIGVSYTKKAVNRLLGDSPPEELIKKIEEVSKHVPLVKDVHNIKVHNYGEKKAISLHMHSEPGTMRNAHDLAHRLEKKLEEEFNATVEVHFDPWMPPKDKIESTIQEYISKKEGIKGIHKIDISETDDSIFISFHMVVPKQEEVGIAHEKATRVEEEIKEILSNEISAKIRVQVHIEPCSK
ncbi:MAG: cation-efflux pump [Thermoplasmatota archaeon]